MGTGSEPFNGSDHRVSKRPHDYVQDGVHLLELAKDVFSVQTAKFNQKAEIAEFRVFELHMEGKPSPQPFANPLIFLHLPTRLGKEKRPVEPPLPATFVLCGGEGGIRTHGGR